MFEGLTIILIFGFITEFNFFFKAYRNLVAFISSILSLDAAIPHFILLKGSNIMQSYPLSIRIFNGVEILSQYL